MEPLTSESIDLKEYARSLYDPEDDYRSEALEDESKAEELAEDPRMYPGEENTLWYE
jgi:hypothetical protein